MPTYNKCDYRDAVKCGIQNKHWTLRTIVSVGKKFSIFSTYLYDERGQVLATSSHTAWGMIRWKPQWKLTKVKQKTMYGPSETEIFEMWPPKLEEIPPLISPRTVDQSKFGFYGSIKRSGCKTKSCKR